MARSPAVKKFLVGLRDHEFRAFKRLHAAIGPDLEPSELFGYLLEWADERRREGVLWTPPKPRRQWREQDLAMLGKISDSDLSKRIGRSEYLIEQKRLDLGIPAYQE